MSSSELEVVRWQRALASLAGSGNHAPDAERIFDALYGDLGVEERRAVVEELTRDPDAAEAWRLAQELTPVDVSITSSPLVSVWKWVAVAAAVLLVVGLGWNGFDSPATNEPTYRSGEPHAIASTLPPEEALSRTQATLRWTAIEGARYRIRVLTPELEVLELADDLTAAQYTVTPSALRRVPSGGPILWQVEARVPGRASIVSPTFTARVE